MQPVYVLERIGGFLRAHCIGEGDVLGLSQCGNSRIEVDVNTDEVFAAALRPNHRPKRQAPDLQCMVDIPKKKYFAPVRRIHSVDIRKLLGKRLPSRKGQGSEGPGHLFIFVNLWFSDFMYRV